MKNLANMLNKWVLNTQQKYHGLMVQQLHDFQVCKLIETLYVEKLNWRQELHKFLRAYRATPHPMTKKSPAALLYNGRTFKTRLLTPTSKSVLFYDQEVRQKQETYEDQCR